MKEFDYSEVKKYKLYNFIKVVFRPLVKVVFQAPRPPLKAIISPGLSVFANSLAKAAVSASLFTIIFSKNLRLLLINFSNLI